MAPAWQRRPEHEQAGGREREQEQAWGNGATGACRFAGAPPD